MNERMKKICRQKKRIRKKKIEKKVGSRRKEKQT